MSQKKSARSCGSREGDPLEIYTGTAGEVILKKYSPISELGQIAESFAETASTVLGLPVLISDTDRFIAASGLRKKDYLNQQIDTALDEIIQCKEKSRTASRLVVPILTNGDPIWICDRSSHRKPCAHGSGSQNSRTWCKASGMPDGELKKERPHMAQGMSCHFARRSLFSVDPVKLLRFFGRFVYSCSR